jgi:hypothetical protein
MLFGIAAYSIAHIQFESLVLIYLLTLFLKSVKDGEYARIRRSCFDIFRHFSNTMYSGDVVGNHVGMELSSCSKYYFTSFDL